ncbi:hypothetical protein FRC12_007539 [Ceratobasidium sp. 428]|nr:hypothetical protein FRC12_007539 [Ceratobasidium sp. 428]
MTTLGATLKRLTFNLRVNIGQQLQVHYQPLRNLEVLYNSFPILERLDFVSFTPGKPSEQNISDWLGNMDTIQKWRELVPSLKVVVAFGRVID